jgi:hypothetical protein
LLSNWRADQKLASLRALSCKQQLCHGTDVLSGNPETMPLTLHVVHLNMPGELIREMCRVVMTQMDQFSDFSRRRDGLTITTQRRAAAEFKNEDLILEWMPKFAPTINPWSQQPPATKKEKRDAFFRVFFFPRRCGSRDG